PDITHFVAMLLRDLADITSADNIQQARHKLEKERFDLVILDLGLPDGSGLELLPSLHYQTVPIPVVIFSAQEMNVEAIHNVAASLVKSRTSNQNLLDTIKALISPTDSSESLPGATTLSNSPNS
ncbi:MAG: response regulator, partial [Leptolyngbyaceae bacterium]|nr:response regulator [Leptolyngbyaceae bacterium]